MKKDFEFYLAMDGEAPKDPEQFQKSLTTAYIYGIEPLEYHEDTVVDTEDGNKVVTTIILLKCRQRWRGACKRFFRKAKFSYLQKAADGLHVYG